MSSLSRQINWDSVVAKVVDGALPFPKSCVEGFKRETVLEWNAVPNPKVGNHSMLVEIRKAVKDVISVNKIQKIGVWLSGGIDSSLLAALAAELLGPRNVTAYTLAFENSDESSWAKMVTDHVGCRHIVEDMRFEENLRLFKDAVRNEMSPISSSTPVLKLAQLCQKHRDTKMFSALGLDELCGGYPRHATASDADFPKIEFFYYNYCNYHYAWMQSTQTKNAGELFFPFLQPELVAVCRGYPRGYKTRGLETKVKIRDELHVEELLPKEIIERGRVAGSKEGFHPNIPTWWEEGLHGWVKESLPPNAPFTSRIRLWMVRQRRRRNMWFLWRLASINTFREVAEDYLETS